MTLEFVGTCSISTYEIIFIINTCNRLKVTPMTRALSCFLIIDKLVALHQVAPMHVCLPLSPTLLGIVLLRIEITLFHAWSITCLLTTLCPKSNYLYFAPWSIIKDNTLEEPH